MLAMNTLAEAKTWSKIVLSAESWAEVSNLRAQLVSESHSVCAHLYTSIPANHLPITDNTVTASLYRSSRP